MQFSKLINNCMIWYVIFSKFLSEAQNWRRLLRSATHSLVFRQLLFCPLNRQNVCLSFQDGHTYEKYNYHIASSTFLFSFSESECGCPLEWSRECLSFDHTLCRISKVRCSMHVHHCIEQGGILKVRWGPSRSANRHTETEVSIQK